MTCIRGGVIGMADAAGGDFHQDLMLLGGGQLYLLNLEGRALPWVTAALIFIDSLLKT